MPKFIPNDEYVVRQGAFDNIHSALSKLRYFSDSFRAVRQVDLADDLEELLHAITVNLYPLKEGKYK